MGSVALGMNQWEWGERGGGGFTDEVWIKTIIGRMGGGKDHVKIVD